MNLRVKVRLFINLMIIDNIKYIDIPIIAEFQILMAKETENKDLNI